MKNVAKNVKKVLDEQSFNTMSFNQKNNSQAKHVKSQLIKLNNFLTANSQSSLTSDGYELIPTHGNVELLNQKTSLKNINDTINWPCDYFYFSIVFDDVAYDNLTSEDYNKIQKLQNKLSLNTKYFNDMSNKYPNIDINVDDEGLNLVFQNIDDLDEAIECFKEIVTTFNL